VSLLAPLLLAERVTAGVYGVLAAGIVGTILVVKPTPELINMPAAIRFGGSFTSALAHLAVRRLNATHRPEVIVLYFNLITLAGSVLTAIPSFVVPNTTQWVLLLGIAGFATIGQLLMTNAYRLDVAPVVSASSYTSVGFSLIIGYLFWSELPDTLALIGGAVVIIAGTALAYGRHLSQATSEDA
jgi:drug/metabolite transporter (DMT)-like permease